MMRIPENHEESRRLHETRRAILQGLRNTRKETLSVFEDVESGVRVPDSGWYYNQSSLKTEEARKNSAKAAGSVNKKVFTEKTSSSTACTTSPYAGTKPLVVKSEALSVESEFEASSDCSSVETEFEASSE